MDPDHGRDSRFESAMRHSGIGMCLIAPDGSFLEVNEALCTMLGRDEGALRASTWQELTHPDDVAADLDLLGEIFAGTRDAYRRTKRYLRPDGTVVHGDLSVVGMRSADRRIDYFIAQVVDVTDELRLRDRLRLLAENATDVVAFGDNDGVVQWISDAVTRVAGWAPEDMQGRPWSDFVHPDDLPVMRSRQARLAGGEAAEMDLRIRSAAGTYRWASFRVRPVLDDGRPVGRVAAWWDSEEEHQAREALSRSEERFRASLDAQADVHIFLDAVRDGSGRVVDVVLNDGNEAAFDFLGLDRTGAVGTRVFSRLPPEHGQPLLDAYARTIETGEPLVIDGWRTAAEPAEEPRIFDLRAVRVGDGLSVSAREVTDRVHAVEALQASERQALDLAERYARLRDEALEASTAKTQFLSRMSHELRTPLNAILGFAQLLELEDLTVDQRDFVGQILTGGRHLLGLVSEVLDVSRIESGRLALSVEPVSVADAVDEAIDLVLNQAAAAGVRVRREGCPGCEHHVRGDRQRVIQVLVNLLSNGIKYNDREGAWVDVYCASRGDGMLGIVVRDNGPGVPADQVGRLFAPFDRLGAEQSAVEGTGIGLALSQGLAVVMGGRIEVETVPGEGSTFALVLARSDPVPDGPEPTAVVRRPVESHSVDVLYVEDNPANRQLMAHIVRLRPAATLRTAASGATGIDAAVEQAPDLVLLDLHLPDLQGDTVLARLREVPTLAAVPVVIVTADASPGLDDELRRLGAADVVTKPVDVDEVLRWIDRVADRTD